jgi:hypothetical protein
MRFISHLDWLEMAERILIRAGLPVAHSEGYRPRMIMKGTPPLPIGVESQCELLQIFLLDRMDPKDVANRLMNSVPRYVDLNWVSHMRFMPLKNPYKAIAAAEYTIGFKEELTIEKRKRVVSLVESLVPDTEGEPISSGPEPALLKPVGGRIIRIDDAEGFLMGESNEIKLTGKMDPNETLHAAKFGFFLFEAVPLTRYPRIIKTGYLRKTNGRLEPVFKR